MSNPLRPKRVLLLLLALSAQAVRAGDAEGVHLRWAGRPSLHIGRWFQLDLRTTIETDFRRFPELEEPPDLFRLRRARVGLEGQFLRDFQYEVEADFADKDDRPLRDVFLNYRRFRRFEIRAGKMKIPFSLERMNSHRILDFVERSLVVRNLSPERDVGLLVRGALYRQWLNYQVGVFRRDGRGARSAGRTFAARLGISPLRGLHAGGAVTVGDAAESENPRSERGLGYTGERFFREVFTKGRRRAVGLEGRWMRGPAKVQSEYIQVRERRREQGLSGEDLPDLISRGWYLSGTWVVTGEPKEGRVVPHRNFVPGRGWGAVEAVIRWEQLAFESARGDELRPPSRSLRAYNVVGNRDRAVVFGANWWWNRYTRVMFNAVRESYSDAERAPIPEQDFNWAGVLRLQFVL